MLSMRHRVPMTIAALVLSACGAREPAAPPPAFPDESRDETAGGSAPEAPEAPPESGSTDISDFTTSDSGTPKEAQGATPSKIKPTRTEAALKFVVVDKDKGPKSGIVIVLTAPSGRKYYTPETDMNGYTELLAPVGQKYTAVYMSLGRREIAAAVPVTSEPFQSIRLTLRYKRIEMPEKEAPPPRMVLEGVNFDTGKATLRKDSFPQFESIIEYMTYKPSARIEISGHTDNSGNVKGNKLLSQERAETCRDYLISKGIDGGRLEAVGYGDERPIEPNTTEAGRQKNRRIEASEL